MAVVTCVLLSSEALSLISLRKDLTRSEDRHGFDRDATDCFDDLITRSLITQCTSRMLICMTHPSSLAFSLVGDLEVQPHCQSVLSVCVCVVRRVVIWSAKD